MPGAGGDFTAAGGCTAPTRPSAQNVTNKIYFLTLLLRRGSPFRRSAAASLVTPLAASRQGQGTPMPVMINAQSVSRGSESPASREVYRWA
jgi:hypothetical protein